MPTPAKEQQVAELKQELSEVSGLILTDYRGLTVAQMNGLRGSVREAGGRYRVVKNRLFKVAAQGTAAEEMTRELTGPTGVVFVPEGDPAIAKAILDYAQDNKDLEVTAGLLDGQALAADDVKTWASVPPLPVLLGEIAGALEAPLSGIVMAAEAVAGEVAHLVDALAAQKSEAAA